MAIPGTVAPRLGRLRTRPAALWLLPLVVAALSRYQPDRTALGVKVLVALGVISLVARRPQVAVLVLVALLPFQTVMLATAFRLGLPASVVRELGFWKEAIVAGCLLAAVRNIQQHGRQRRPCDAIDALALVYLGIVGLYYLFPRLFVHPSGPVAIGPPTDTTTLATALRNDAVFVVLLLAARRLPLGRDFRRRFVATLFVTGTVVAAVGLFEFAFSNAWNHLIVATLQTPRYLSTVLHVSIPNPDDIRVYSQVAGRNVLRIGSVFLNPLSCGFYLVIAAGLGMERLVRNEKRLLLYLTTALIGVAILLTQTRAAIIAVVIVVAGTLRPSIERSRPARARYAVIAAAGLLAVVPLTLSTGLAARASGTVGGEESTQLHISRAKAGAGALIAAPLGRGLGTGATNGTRFQVATTLTSENYYLQVGNETGAVSMALFIALVLVLARRLRCLARGRRGILVASWRGIFLGLSIAALLLQVWLDFALAWTVWIGLGIGIGPPDGQTPRAVEGTAGDIRRHLAAAARHWPLVLVTAAAAVLAARPAPVDRPFTAHSSVVIGLRQYLDRPAGSKPSRDPTSLLDRQRHTFGAAVSQLPLASEAVARAGVARAPAVAAAETTAVAPPRTQLLQISVADRDPAVARSLADGLAEALVADAPADASVSIFEHARPPSRTPFHASTSRLAEAAAFGVLAALGGAIVVDCLDVEPRPGGG